MTSKYNYYLSHFYEGGRIITDEAVVGPRRTEDAGNAESGLRKTEKDR